jgi:hypothetical protein
MNANKREFKRGTGLMMNAGILHYPWLINKLASRDRTWDEYGHEPA